MTEYVAQQLPIVEAALVARGELMSEIEDTHLECRPVPASPSLGDLCRESGVDQDAYVRAFRTFDLRLPRSAEGPRTIARHTAWFIRLDAELVEVLIMITDDQLPRSLHLSLSGTPASIQLHIYPEALFILCVRAQVYAKTLGGALPDEFRWWLGGTEDLPEPKTT